MPFQNATPQAIRFSTGRALDYTAGGTPLLDGTVILNGRTPMVVSGDIPANTLGSVDDNGVWDIVKDSSTFAAGDPVYWNATGNPVVGTAGTGAASSSPSGANLMGSVVPGGAAATGVATVRVKISASAAVTSTAIAGSLGLSVGGSTAAAGSTHSDATGLPAGTAAIYPTTAADDTEGVIIDVADKVTGRMLFIGNGVANKILKVYGPSGAVINGGSADAAFSSVSGKGVIIACLSGAGNTWLAW